MNEEESNGMYQRTWVRKGHPNAALDFNAIAQGYTVDLLLEEIRLRGVMNAMVELGGEVVCRGVNASGNPWRIAVDRPLAGTGASDRVLETVVSVKDRAICTSGNYRKFYEQGGRRYSHTIDPATGYPAENGLLSATVLAPSAAYADALATAFMVLGAEQTRGFLATYPGLGLDVLLMSDDGEGGYTLWETPGSKLFLPHSDFRLLQRPSRPSGTGLEAEHHKWSNCRCHSEAVDCCWSKCH